MYANTFRIFWRFGSKITELHGNKQYFLSEYSDTSKNFKVFDVEGRNQSGCFRGTRVEERSYVRIENFLAFLHDQGSNVGMEMTFFQTKTSQVDIFQV